MAIYHPDEHFKTLEECKSDAEFRIYLNRSIEAGTWGDLTVSDILPYILWDITNPENIKGYIECNIPPDKAWKMELLLTPEHKGRLDLLSPIRLGSALRKAKVEYLVLDAINKGARTELMVLLALHNEHPEITEDDVNEVFDDVITQGILG